MTKNPELTEDQILNRKNTIFHRQDFVPTDYPLVSNLATLRMLGRNPIDQAHQALKKGHQIDHLSPDITQFIEAMFGAPVSLRGSMAQSLHEAVEMIQRGVPPQTILDFLGAVETKANEIKRSKSEQNAIQSVISNADEIRREAIASVAKKYFSISKESLSSPADVVPMT